MGDHLVKISSCFLERGVSHNVPSFNLEDPGHEVFSVDGGHKDVTNHKR